MIARDEVGYRHHDQARDARQRTHAGFQKRESERDNAAQRRDRAQDQDRAESGRYTFTALELHPRRKTMSQDRRKRRQPYDRFVDLGSGIPRRLPPPAPERLEGGK